MSGPSGPSPTATFLDGLLRFSALCTLALMWSMLVVPAPALVDLYIKGELEMGRDARRLLVALTFLASALFWTWAAHKLNARAVIDRIRDQRAFVD